MRTRTALLPILALAAVGCTQAPAAPPSWTSPPDAARSPVVASRLVEVYKSPTCSCCHEWELYMRRVGFTVRAIPVEDMTAVKAELGVPEDSWSCHTAVIDGYVVEGHVPIEAIDDLFETRPDIDGIALPAMPPGSPGMDGVKAGPFQILALDAGRSREFGSY